jgi:mono/diheme cytochrome c family protein/peroxiredoxin
MHRRFVWIALAVFALAFAGGVGARVWMGDGATDQSAAQNFHSQVGAGANKRGAMLFTLHCAKCHGDAGRGDAEGAEKLKPPPRDFASRPWRFEVSAASIQRVIDQGIPGTSMPAFGATLLDADRQALAEYVLALAGSGEAAEVASYRAAGFFAVEPRPAPALKLEAADGKLLSLADFQGKVVLLNFWGVSCDHCLARMPQLAKFQSQFNAEEFAVVNVCADEGDAAAAAEMLAKSESGLTTYVDPTGLAVGKYEVSLLPTIWLIDREGRQVFKAQGARDWAKPELRELVQGLLRK